jgi:hypothetical protein
MALGSFSNESLNQAYNLLFAEDLTGQCNQEEKRKAQARTRTPEQQQADKLRAQEMQGKAPQVPQGVREQAAQKAAKTREKCHPPKPAGAGEAATKAPTHQPSQYKPAT